MKMRTATQAFAFENNSLHMKHRPGIILLQANHHLVTYVQNKFCISTIVMFAVITTIVEINRVFALSEVPCLMWITFLLKYNFFISVVLDLGMPLKIRATCLPLRIV